MATLLGIAESDLVKYCAVTIAILGLPTVAALLSGQRAAYGRYFTDNNGIYLFNMNGRFAWILQESPCVIIPSAMLLFAANSSCTASLPNMLLVGLYLFHYVHRTLIFPFMLKGKPTPFLIMLMALSFCLINGYMQSARLLRLEVYPDNWIYDPRFIFGTALFFTGMAINIHSDYTLISLRKPGETGYKIPKGGMFTYVSGANFLGEIVEWTGFAIACWSGVAAAFAFFTACNIGPRAVQHHRWYQDKFKDEYPKSRKALIPFVY
eukprot:TRINITY_DN7450_c0_g1_i1.p1 TRINITY_DN7450_c0_g1~~TRINITY_DN7450_c0_g1_i1.p1  ORF type:complete len:265 (+),score=35.08 TRINITY_DN7450_c0_g1_i1:999-1793(+)